MSFANAVPSKHQVSQLQAGREPFASKDKLPSNAGGLEDFLNELNQATNLRMQVQEETATDNRLKGKKAPEVKDSKTDPEVQILHKQEQSTQNPANIADSGARSDPAIAKIMAALEQLNQQNQSKAASLLSNWGETASVGKLDLESLRTNLKNLGFESILGDLEKAQAAGNLEQVAGLQANLAEKLLAQLGNLNAQNKDAQVGILSAKASIDAKTLQALEAQRNQITANQTINQSLQK